MQRTAFQPDHSEGFLICVSFTELLLHDSVPAKLFSVTEEHHVILKSKHRNLTDGRLTTGKPEMPPFTRAVY